MSAKRVMCIAQSEARDIDTGDKCPKNPTFGDVCTIVREVYVYPIGERFYVFSEYTELDLFQARFFVLVDDPADEIETQKHD